MKKNHCRTTTQSGERFPTSSTSSSPASPSPLGSATFGAFHIFATRMGEVGKIIIHQYFRLELFPGTFLLIYFIAMFACGIPIFFQVGCFIKVLCCFIVGEEFFSLDRISVIPLAFQNFSSLKLFIFTTIMISI